MSSHPKRIDLSAEQAGSLIERVRSRTLDEKDCEVLVGIIETVGFLYQALSQKSHSIQRLLRRIFGVKTESAKNILKGCLNDTSPHHVAGSSPEHAPQDKRSAKKGHGRNGASSYPAARRIPIAHEDHRPGDPCPLCPGGKLYLMSVPAVVVRMTGHAPVEPAIFECERLRCNLCGEVFTASLPEGVGHDKYDESARAVIACMKYGSGFPFHRLEKLQESMQAPLPASTQWDEAETLADMVHPVYPELIRHGAQGEVIHNDDTTMRILSLAKALSEEDTQRKGIFTTGVVSIHEDKKIALFFTGNRHAGENLTALLEKRAVGLGPPVQMCDALSRNMPETLKAIISNCLFHARKNFVDVYASFPEECAHFIKLLGKVYHHDAIAKERNLSAGERLRFHQTHSAPVMDEIKGWMIDQIDQKKTEPNSGLGKAIDYMLKRWERFTLFLRIPNAPLDNNICERALKRAVLHRKGSMFFKTEHGAYIGDMFMSLIHTCSLCKANPFHYLVALQKHARELREHPERWLPWNYLDNLPSS